MTPLEDIGIFWALFFVFFISFCYLAVLNIVTGIVCSTAIQSTTEDLDLQVHAHLGDKDKFAKKLGQLFTQIDQDHSGYITRQELDDAIRADEEKAQAVFSAMGISGETALQLCALLDLDGGTKISLAEFVERCLKLRGNAKATDMHLLMEQSRTNCRKLTALLR